MDNTKKAILLVSFGTTHADTRQKTIGALRDEMEKAFPDWTVREAFTSKIVIRILKSRDGILVDSPTEGLRRLAKEGYSQVVVQPTLLTAGVEFDLLKEVVWEYRQCFDSLSLGWPLFETEKDYQDVIDILKESYRIEENGQNAYVFMGHGSKHPADAVYSSLDYRMKHVGLENAFIATVEGYPGLDLIRQELKDRQPEKVFLIPLLIVAGDHAKNDMASDEPDSWKTILSKDGLLTEAIVKGLGEVEGIRKIFVRHACNAMS